MLKQNSEKGRLNELFMLPKTRTEKARNDCFFRTCGLANRIEEYIDFNTKKGLKNRVLNFMWKFVNDRFDEKISVAGIYAVTVKSAEIIGQFSKTTTGMTIPSVKTVNPH